MGLDVPFSNGLQLDAIKDWWQVDLAETDGLYLPILNDATLSSLSTQQCGN